MSESWQAMKERHLREKQAAFEEWLTVVIERAMDRGWTPPKGPAKGMMHMLLTMWESEPIRFTQDQAVEVLVNPKHGAWR